MSSDYSSLTCRGAIVEAYTTCVPDLPGPGTQAEGRSDWAEEAAVAKLALKQRLGSELREANEEAEDLGEPPLSSAAEEACEALIDLLSGMVIWKDLIVCASATNEGGGIVVVEHRPKRRRLSVEVSNDGSRRTAVRVDEDDLVTRALLVSDDDLRGHVDWVSGP